MHISKWKKPIWKAYKQYDFNYMTFWKRQNYWKIKRSVAVKDEGGRRRECREILGGQSYSAWYYNDAYMLL